MLFFFFLGVLSKTVDYSCWHSLLLICYSDAEGIMLHSLLWAGVGGGGGIHSLVEVILTLLYGQ